MGIFKTKVREYKTDWGIQKVRVWKLLGFKIWSKRLWSNDV